MFFNIGFHIVTMITDHRILQADARDLTIIDNNSIDLIVTSPPYPMISMWDELFFSFNSEIKKNIEEKNGSKAFELMHKELDKVWKELYRVLKPGGILCINIGDATRKIGQNFTLYSNHSRIVNSVINLGFYLLPLIIWRKQTNAPNKFMGSGMYPPSAYITLEHEFILIMRKGIKKREFLTEEDKIMRRRSAYLWEERNKWFSDLWTDLKGISQKLTNVVSRSRSAAYPFELAYRLINMYSIYNDTILDPFLGTGTTTLAAIISGRNSIGIEIDEELTKHTKKRILDIIDFGNAFIKKRYLNHKKWVDNQIKSNKNLRYYNNNLSSPVMTKQELEIEFYTLSNIKELSSNKFQATYGKFVTER